MTWLSGTEHIMRSCLTCSQDGSVPNMPNALIQYKVTFSIGTFNKLKSIMSPGGFLKFEAGHCKCQNDSFRRSFLRNAKPSRENAGARRRAIDHPASPFPLAVARGAAARRALLHRKWCVTANLFHASSAGLAVLRRQR